ncbi:MAG: SRPBCC family protein [Chloroflexota bacterium]|nr:SRPBCC family protein [Chloroflexota bacterium]
MGDVSKDTIIAAGVEKVFSYVSDPHNAPRYISSIKRIISGPVGTPSEGQVWRAEASLLGQVSAIDLRLQELKSPHMVTFVIEGEPRARLAVRLRQHDGRETTHVSLSLDVPSVPGIFLQGIMGGLLSGDMARLKDLMEE